MPSVPEGEEWRSGGRAEERRGGVDAGMLEGKPAYHPGLSCLWDRSVTADELPTRTSTSPLKSGAKICRKVELA